MFAGSFVALVTPFAGGTVDVEKLEELVEFQIRSGTHGLVPCGTTGESATLSHEEHELVIRTVVRRADGRVPVLAGTGSNSTSEAIRLSRFAKEVGADGALLITPYYNKPTQEGLKRHFGAVAREVELPLVLYNVPSRTGVNMLPATVNELATIENIVGIKEASGSIDQTVEILRDADIMVFSGDDSLTLPLMAVGARGVISVAANVVPKLMVDLVDLASAGEYSAARDLHYRLFPLFKALFLETNPIPVKAALAIQGRIGTEIRLPLTEISDENRALLEAALDI
ncbi:MAG: 4-hydroxy-tetrahydrodipicolinate synthase [Planctomycetota bacterium]|nr:4-hydroxy-tetrahydrodipicolinate synthase [Planctomycetota bacterium]